jgi:hypothetical protein
VIKKGKKKELNRGIFLLLCMTYIVAVGTPRGYVGPSRIETIPSTLPGDIVSKRQHRRLVSFGKR